MFARNSRQLTGWLLILAIGQGTPCEADDRAASNLETVSVDSCAVKFVNHSTYATSRPGIIAELPFEEGDIVQPGDLIVQLRDEVALANLKLRAAQAEMRTPIEIAEKERDAAKLDLESKIEANGRAPNSFPRTEIDRLRLIYDARILQVTQAQDEFNLAPLAKEQADAEWQSYLVHAKFGGLVTRVHKHIGEAVNLGDQIITIVDTNRVRVEGRIHYEQARKLQVGDPVRIQLDFSTLNQERGRKDLFSEVLDTDEPPARKPLAEEEHVFAGRIGFIGVDTGDDKGLLDEFRVWAEVENHDNILLEGLPAKMTVQVRPKGAAR